MTIDKILYFCPSCKKQHEIIKKDLDWELPEKIMKNYNILTYCEKDFNLIVLSFVRRNDFITGKVTNAYIAGKAKDYQKYKNLNSLFQENNIKNSYLSL